MQLKNKLLSFWPLLFLIPLYWLRSRVIIGNQITWFPQTDFYFICAFIFVISLIVYSLFKGRFALPKSRRDEGGRKRQNLLLLVIFSIAFLLISYFALIRLFDISIEKPDFHAFVTVFWNTAHGDILRSTYLGGARSWFSLHIEPILFLFVPLFWLPLSSIWTASLLQIVQVAVGASGIFPIFFLARKKLNSEVLGIIVALTYLFIPALQFQILYDFHIEIISLVSILWSIYFLEEKRYRPFLLTLLLAVFVREEFAIYASLFGMYILLSNKSSIMSFWQGKLERSEIQNLVKKDSGSRRSSTRVTFMMGMILLISGFSYWLLAKFLIIPFFGQGQIAPAQESMFSNLGNSLFVIIGTLISKPLKILQFMFTERKIQYLALMITSTGFLSLLSPIVLLAIPFFVINLLLNFDLPSSIFWHYQSWLIPIFIWATIDAISKRSEKTKLALCAFLFTACFLSSLFFGPINILNFDLGTTHKGIFQLKKNVSLRTIERVQKLIGEDASVASDAGLSPFFSNRKNYYLFPDTKNADYIVTSLKMLNSRLQLHAIVKKDGYCLRAENGILIYKKQKSCELMWRDDLIDENIIEPKKLPITASKINQLTIITFKSAFKPSKRNANTLYVLESQLHSLSPSEVKIEASPDGKTFHSLILCSTLSASPCSSRIDVSELTNRNGEIYFRIYLLADGRSAVKPSDVMIGRFFLRSLTVK